MFTGIVEGVGTVAELTHTGKGARIAVETTLDLEGGHVGDSIAVDGCCLTAVSLTRHAFWAEASHETLACTTLGGYAVGRQVNLERPVRVSDRLGGHIVQGHVDAAGRVERVVKVGEAIDVHVSVPEALLPEIVAKGSIAIDGISLTVNGLSETGFHVTIIPHTDHVTTIGRKAPGDLVNIETDIIGKYVVGLARRGREERP